MISNLNCFNDSDYALLPFTAVMIALQAEVEWKDEMVAEIMLGGEKYTLTTNTASLIKDGSDFNCIIPTPGSKVYYQAVSQELLLDHITLRTVAELMGIKLSIEVNYQDRIININHRM